MDDSNSKDIKDYSYKSKFGRIDLEFKGNLANKTIYFESMTYEPEYVKIFLLTLKKAINDFITMGYTTVQQRVSNYDWDNYLKQDDRWNVITKDKYTDTYIISCNILDALDCIAFGFGITQQITNYKTVV